MRGRVSIRASSNPYFPVSGQNRIHIFPNLDKISEYTDLQSPFRSSYYPFFGSCAKKQENFE